MSAPTTSFVGAGRPRAGSAEFNVIVLEDLLADPPTPEERTERRSELKWFDAEIKPFLYRLVRYELKLPGGLSAWRDYWICPRANFKIDLRSGIVYRLSDGRRVGYYFTLFMYCR